MRLIHLDEVRRRRARRERLSPAVQGLAWAALGLAWFGVASVLLGWILTPDERARIVAASPLAMGAACLLASVSLHVWLESPRRSATPRGARGWHASGTASRRGRRAEVRKGRGSKRMTASVARVLTVVRDLVDPAPRAKPGSASRSRSSSRATSRAHGGGLSVRPGGGARSGSSSGCRGVRRPPPVRWRHDAGHPS